MLRMILEMIDDTEEEYNGIKRTTTRLYNLKKAREVCRHWYYIGINLVCIEEYRKYEVQGMIFCSICEMPWTNDWAYREKHQDVGYDIIHTKDDTKLTRPHTKHKLINHGYEWECKEDNCIRHCLEKPGHCRNGIIQEYLYKDLMQYTEWRQKRIEEHYNSQKKHAQVVFEIESRIFVEQNRAIQKQIKIIDDGNNKKPKVIIQLFKKRTRKDTKRDNRKKNNNTKDNTKRCEIKGEKPRDEQPKKRRRI